MIGLKSPLIDKKTSMLGLCMMSIWREIGLAMMIYLAGLKSIPSDINEAAIIDGANFWQRFRNVTVPFLAPAFTYCIPLWRPACACMIIPLWRLPEDRSILRKPWPTISTAICSLTIKWAMDRLLRSFIL